MKILRYCGILLLVPISIYLIYLYYSFASITYDGTNLGLLAIPLLFLMLITEAGAYLVFFTVLCVNGVTIYLCSLYFDKKNLVEKIFSISLIVLFSLFICIQVSLSIVL